MEWLGEKFTKSTHRTVTSTVRFISRVLRSETTMTEMSRRKTGCITLNEVKMWILERARICILPGREISLKPVIEMK
jgi:hypothetical protein